jgi:hypothetical protein
VAILLGLIVSLLGASGIACGVLGLSNLYVGQWSTALGLLAGTAVLGAGFALGWRSFQIQFIAAEPGADHPATAPMAVPRLPALLAGFWLVAIAAVLASGAWGATGIARWLSAGTAVCLCAVGVSIVLARSAR